MKKAFLIVCVLAVCLALLTGCGAKTVRALSPNLTVDTLRDAIVSVAFDADGFDAEAGTLSLEAFDKVYYDAVDVAEMKVKDTIVSPVSGSLVINSLEKDGASGILINGGVENGGITLWPEGGGVFCQMLGFDDAYVMQSLGKTTLPVSEKVTLYDSADLSAPAAEISAGKLADYLRADTFSFNARNTNILVEDGVITEIHRVYTP